MPKDSRNLVVAFRGTVLSEEWVIDVDAYEPSSHVTGAKVRWWYAVLVIIAMMVRGGGEEDRGDVAPVHSPSCCMRQRSQVTMSSRLACAADFRDPCWQGPNPEDGFVHPGIWDMYFGDSGVSEWGPPPLLLVAAAWQRR